MFGSRKSSSEKEERKGTWGIQWKSENMIPGIILGFVLGFISDLLISSKSGPSRSSLPSSTAKKLRISANDDDELKMVLVVRQDLKMGTGKIASQCAHAAVGMYEQLLHSQRSLLMQWWQCGQPKIVVKCKNQREMDKLKEEADSIGLPTFSVSDAGRTQIAAGSRTVLAIGPGRKPTVDSVTGRLHLL